MNPIWHSWDAIATACNRKKATDFKIIVDADYFLRHSAAYSLTMPPKIIAPHPHPVEYNDLRTPCWPAPVLSTSQNLLQDPGWWPGNRSKGAKGGIRSGQTPL